MLMYNLLLALAAATVQASNSHEEGDSQKPMSSTDYVCQHPHSQTHIVSTSPLVIYIENFLTAEEREHFLEIT